MSRTIPIFFVLLSLTGFCIAEIIPEARRTQWQPGVPNGIPEVTGPVESVIDHGADPTGSSDSRQAFIAAIETLPEMGGVVLIPEGTYLVTNTITVSKDNVIFRGEGIGKTRLLHDHSGLCFETITYKRGQWQNFTDFQKGTNTVTVDNGSAFTVGQFAEIMQDNDPVLMYTESNWNQSWAEGAVGQLFEVTEISGDQITFRSPIHYEVRSDLNPQIRPQGFVTGVGFENFYIERLQTGNSTFQFKNAAYCWIRGIESYHTRKSHVTNNTTLGCEFRDSYFHHSFSYGGGGSGYGVEFGYHCTDGLCENNVFDSLRHSMMVHVGAVGCVFGYNYSINPVQGDGETDLNQGWIPADISLHGHYGQMNLFEGNVVQEIGISDYWGPMGPGNTFLRNVVEGQGIFLYDHSHSQNLVGNVSTTWNDDGTSENTIRHGENIDGSLTWDQSIASRSIPSSYYLQSKPAFFGSVSWPFMGDNIEGSRKNPAQLRHEGEPLVTATPSVKNIARDNCFTLKVSGDKIVSSFYATSPAHARFFLRDLRGRTVGSPIETSISTGQHTISLETKHLTPGMYFCVIKTDEKEYMRPFICR
ncbi:MAG: glycosyl hydrolase family 28-related protein [Chitinispirillaceae bacterium]